MTQPKTKCTKCGTSILQSTAARNSGRCKPCATGPKFENTAGGMELGMRLILGSIFAGVAGGLGFGIGSVLGTIGGLVFAVPLAMIGFCYGCFCVQINAILRSILPFIFDR